MRPPSVTTVLALAGVATTAVSLELTKEMMEISRDAADLSSKAYNKDSDGSAYDDFEVYTDPPDQAIVARKGGFCYGAFRGTTGGPTGADWQQNFDLGMSDICNTAGKCCEAREGYVDAYNTKYKDKFEEDLRACAAKCTDKDKCVILTGHSQGGAAAQVASIALHDMNPITVTFGQPPAVKPCDLINGDRCYRYVNTVVDETQLIGNPDLEYDPVAFVPGLGSKDFGHLIVLPPPGESSGVAYFGKDVDTLRELTDNLDVGFSAHNIDSEKHGYLQKIEMLISAGKFPVPTDGFKDGTPCIQNSNCKSGRCDSLKCKTVKEACEPCNENSDCKSDKCLGDTVPGSNFGTCASEKTGLIPTGCPCTFDSNCESGRCEGVTKWRCEEKLDNGSRCNENNDCKSGRCDDRECKARKEACGDCSENSDCISNKCLGDTGPGAFGTCASADTGLIPTGCPCTFDSNCESGRCEGTFKWRCEAKLPDGERCNENNDCMSGECKRSGWRLRRKCASKSRSKATKEL